MDSKKNMRLTVLARRDLLSPQVRDAKSEEICCAVELHIAEVFEHPRIGVFNAMRSEVDLSELVASAYRQGWEVCFPCMVRNNPKDAQEPMRMVFYRVPGEHYEGAYETLIAHPFRCRRHNDLAADGYERITPHELDAVIVPLVAFDSDGNRLGYGGGNYDRLLPALRQDALVVGVAFEEQRVDAVPCEPHDQPLPCIITA